MFYFLSDHKQKILAPILGIFSLYLWTLQDWISLVGKPRPMIVRFLPGLGPGPITFSESKLLYGFSPETVEFRI